MASLVSELFFLGWPILSLLCPCLRSFNTRIDLIVYLPIYQLSCSLLELIASTGIFPYTFWNSPANNSIAALFLLFALGYRGMTGDPQGSAPSQSIHLLPRRAVLGTLEHNEPFHLSNYNLTPCFLWCNHDPAFQPHAEEVPQLEFTLVRLEALLKFPGCESNQACHRKFPERMSVEHCANYILDFTFHSAGYNAEERFVYRSAVVKYWLCGHGLVLRTLLHDIYNAKIDKLPEKYPQELKVE